MVLTFPKFLAEFFKQKYVFENLTLLEYVWGRERVIGEKDYDNPSVNDNMCLVKRI